MPPVLVGRDPFPPSGTRGRGGAEGGEDTARGCRAAGGGGDAEEEDDDDEEEDMITSTALVEDGGGGGGEGVEERTRSSFL